MISICLCQPRLYQCKAAISYGRLTNSSVWYGDGMTWKCFPHYWTVCREKPPVIGEYPPQRVNNVEFLCLFCCQAAHAYTVEQTVALSVVFISDDAHVTPMQCYTYTVVMPCGWLSESSVWNDNSMNMSYGWVTKSSVWDNNNINIKPSHTGDLVSHLCHAIY